MNKIVIVLVTVLLFGFGGYFLFRGSGRGENNGSTAVDRERAQTTVRQGSSPSNYVDYSADDYEKARSEGKVVMLYFTANWCPTCNAQEPINLEAFKEVEGDADIVIFKTHILDSETTDETEGLADEFEVRLQHTFVIINPSGEVVFTHTGPLVKEDIVKNLLEAKS